MRLSPTRLSGRAIPSNRGIGVAAVFAAVLLAACTSNVRQVPVDVASAAAPRAATGFEGDWISTDQVAVSRFAGGVFTTTAVDTGKTLADGSYAVTDPRTAQITVVSRIRNTTNNVTCLLATQAQLNCTSSTGQQFVLTRRA